MLSHMLLQLPAITVAGSLLCGNAPCLRRLAPFDAHGLSVLSAALFASAYWMIPRALELSLTSSLSESLKFATLFALGAALPGAIERANVIIELFFMGNFCAMTAIVGLLYQDQPRQLCNAYLPDDQSMTGSALVIAACALALRWCVQQVRAASAPAADGQALN
ncbi:hypothetical protein [Massilia sp. PWRC2]|uniref:hypothetical protein n=1 Tax=Massilia sp. PWRC2 TaxID=2804626 RepID=UPI003CF1A896